MVGAMLPGSDRMCGQARWGACNGHLGKCSEHISGRSRIDRRDRVERDDCRHRASASERESRELTVGVSHDVSTVLGIGRQRGWQAREHLDHGMPYVCCLARAHAAAPA